ncbi:acyltransferase family protein [Azotobacter vinelandii]
MPNPHPQPLPAADGIRGLACLIVLVMHGISFCWPEAFPLLRGGGKYGVWLFFVLSAFLLTLRLQQRGFTAVSLLDYALGRILRILPLFTLACLLYYWAGMGIQNTDQLHAALTFEQGFIHLWTIPVEFKFYLLLPPLAWAGLCLKRRLGNAAILLAGTTLLVLQQSVWPYWQTPEKLGGYSLVFAFVPVRNSRSPAAAIPAQPAPHTPGHAFRSIHFAHPATGFTRQPPVAIQHTVER